MSRRVVFKWTRLLITICESNSVTSSLHQCLDIKYGKWVHILPLTTQSRVLAEILSMFIRNPTSFKVIRISLLGAACPYTDFVVCAAYWPVRKGDTAVARRQWNSKSSKQTPQNFVSSHKTLWPWIHTGRFCSFTSHFSVSTNLIFRGWSHEARRRGIKLEWCRAWRHRRLQKTNGTDPWIGRTPFTPSPTF